MARYNQFPDRPESPDLEPPPGIHGFSFNNDSSSSSSPLFFPMGLSDLDDSTDSSSLTDSLDDGENSPTQRLRDDLHGFSEERHRLALRKMYKQAYGLGALPSPDSSPPRGRGRLLDQPHIKELSEPRRELLWYTRSPNGTVVAKAQPYPRRTPKNSHRLAAGHASKRRRIMNTAESNGESSSDSTDRSGPSMQLSYLDNQSASVSQGVPGQQTPLTVSADNGRSLAGLLDNPFRARHDDSTVLVEADHTGLWFRRLANRDRSRSDDGLDSQGRDYMAASGLYQQSPPLSVDDQQNDDQTRLTQARFYQQPGLFNPLTSSGGLASCSTFADSLQALSSFNTLQAGDEDLEQRGYTASSGLLQTPYPSPLALDSVFLSQIIPKHYQSKQRHDILQILNSRDYIPLCVSSRMRSRKRAVKCPQQENMTSNRAWVAPLGPSGVGWPPGKIPLEIFQHIGRHLPRDAKANMRLVNGESEEKISDSFFETAVVPFRTGVFDTDYSGDELPQDGMRVFKNWGGSIKRFALSFEVEEGSLLGLRPKSGEVMVDTSYGPQRWYNDGYSRFEAAAKYEMTADEERKMTMAFSKLTGLRELGLSVISSQGWLRGADVSDRAAIFSSKSMVFGPSALPDKALRDSMDRWEKIKQDERQLTTSTYNRNKAKRCFFQTRAIILQTEFGEPLVYFEPELSVRRRQNTPIMFNGANYEAKIMQDLRDEEHRYDERKHPQVHRHIAERLPGSEEDSPRPPPPPPVEETSPFPEHVVPNALTQLQMEWLMEMEWAQSAFLSSWTTAILNNPNVFDSLKAVNVANLSSNYLVALKRVDLWKAFPNLRSLTVLVHPDWQRVFMDGADQVKDALALPSMAYEDFTQLLTFLFGGANPAITVLYSLKVGYVGGGEHATGMFARNRNVLPAPILENPADVNELKGLNPLSQKDSVTFTQIRHLTFTNCWFSPDALRAFFKKMKGSEVFETITFDSVSLCAQEPDAMDKTEMRALASMTFNQRQRSWFTHDPIKGLWSDVINEITPGRGIQHARYQKRLAADYPPASDTSLQRITFKSCGYVRLVYNYPDQFDQTTVTQTVRSLPDCLILRHKRLWDETLCVPDSLLGTVAQAMRPEGEGCLVGVWGLRVGGLGEEQWGPSGEGRLHCREDGQAEGGMGRFSGCVEKSEDED